MLVGERGKEGRWERDKGSGGRRAGRRAREEDRDTHMLRDKRMIAKEEADSDDGEDDVDT